MSNDDWMAGLSDGREETVAALRDRIRSGLGAAMANRSDVDDADLDDFTQEAVVRVLDQLATFRGNSKFTTWAMAVAVRVSLTAMRRRRWKDRSLDELLDDPVADSDGDAAAASDSRRELFSAMRTAIDDALAPRQRQVLLAELSGVPQVVLADQLGMTPSAVYKATHDARKRLKVALQDRGFHEEAVKEVLAGDG